MTKSREDVLGVLFGLLKDAAVDERVDLSPENASETTLGSLRLDSLDTLVLAMGLEDAFNIEIRVVDLPKDSTISQIADYVVGLK
jgi:acyl carrier protein